MILCARRRLIAAVALAALLAVREASADICVEMNVRLDEHARGALIESMATEAASIWGAYGVRLQWREAPALAQCAWTQASFDVRLDPPPAGKPSLAVVLGSTHLADGAINHVPIQLDRRATERVLVGLPLEQRARLLGRASVGPLDVGRALGRVLAHEIGHVLLAARDHQPRGLMRAAYLAADLLAPQRHAYVLSPAEITRLRHRERALTDLAAMLRFFAPLYSAATVAGEPLRARR